MKVAIQEERAAALPRPPMSHHTLLALASAYVRYLSQRTGKSAEFIQDRFYTEKGLTAEREPAQFRRWAGDKVYVMDQLRLDPFAAKEGWD